ncbi:hypothetical protein [Mucilaginibacter lacusdianchii]|uniref:hypothetical protein n=1 Tax=Mucilaginibacter lacusdianchii TaxID=2684211 RepID=UPI00131ACFA0|nr:hypothetical protein [Mucilaginibacter sp. JXJ CY 39]
MSQTQSLQLNIGTRKINVTPDQSAERKDGKLTGLFYLTENDENRGTLRFDKQSWENKNTGDLSYVELEAIAEAIMTEYK